jgi:hypothetical protein
VHIAKVLIHKKNMGINYLILLPPVGHPPGGLGEILTGFGRISENFEGIDESQDTSNPISANLDIVNPSTF